MSKVCHYCGGQIDGNPEFILTHCAGEGQLEQRLCSENCLVALAVGSPTIGGRP